MGGAWWVVGGGLAGAFREKTGVLFYPSAAPVVGRSGAVTWGGGCHCGTLRVPMLMFLFPVWESALASPRGGAGRVLPTWFATVWRLRLPASLWD